MGYSPRGRKELDMTEQLYLLQSQPTERHGNPLQYSCLENPLDRGDWQATVHRVTDSVSMHAGSSVLLLLLLLSCFSRV